ncbi:MAG: BatA and WFA domain-containing protein [Chthoniobacteraceae bacterium]
MTWLQPWAAWFLAGLPLIVMLYMLKVRRRPVTVSTLIFWQRVVQEHRRRALFQRLRSLLSLLLHLLIFALIVAALARPTLDRFVRDGASAVVVLDVRARMSALESDGETRLAKAAREGLATVRDASASRQFALITAGPQATVLVPFTGDERVLREALAQVDPTDAGGDLAPALALANDLLATRQGERRTIVFTDRPVTGSHTARIVGTPRDNAGITRFAARPLPASPSTSEVLIEVRNFGRAELKTNLELRYDDRLLDVKPLAIEPGGKQSLVFPSVPRPTATARGHFTATLDTTDALAADNLARVWLPPPRPVRVLLISRGNVFLEKALSADPTISYELLAPDAWSDALGTKFDVVLFDDFLPATTAPVAAFYVKRTPFDAAGPPLDQPALTEIDTTHPTLRLLDFTQTTVLRAQSLALPPPDSEWSYIAPLRSFDHALFIVGEKRGEKPLRVAALGLDLAATDLPLRVAFPLLVTHTVHWLAGTNVELPTAVRAAERAPFTNGFIPQTREGRAEWLAVNTFDEAESNLLFDAAPKDPATPLPYRNALAGFAAWPFWRYLALGALVLFTLEWSLFHRRRTE